MSLTPPQPIVAPGSGDTSREGSTVNPSTPLSTPPTSGSAQPQQPPAQSFELVRKFQAAFDSIVIALTKYDVDRAAAQRAAAEESEARQKVETEAEEAKRKAAEEQKREEPDAVAPHEEASAQQSKAASPAPTQPPVEEKDKRTKSLFGALSSTPLASAAPSPAPTPVNYTAVASKAIVKALRELLEGCGTAKEAAKCAPYAPWVATLLMQHSGILEDHNVALFAVCFCNSACTFAPHLDTVIDGDVIYDFILTVIKIHRRQKKITHVCFSGLVNVCHAPKLSATTITPLHLVEYLAPLHAEAPVVEAWCMAATNICLRFPIHIKSFCDLGAVEMLERLLMLFGDDPRILSRGLTLLAIFTQQTVLAEATPQQQQQQHQ